MQEDIFTRWATVNDAAALVTLNYEFNGVRMSEEDVVESMKSSNELVAVAELGGLVVGFACAQYFKSFCYHSLQGEITEMYVTESARRQGIATKLLSFLEKKLKELNVTTVKVLTGKNNRIAKKTYEKSNYSLTDEVHLVKRF